LPLNLKVTMKSENKKNNKSYQCDYRELAFPYPCYVKRHVQSVHVEDKLFKCVQCEKSYGIKNHLRQHTLYAHSGLKPFKCGICEKPFNRLGTLKRHVSQVHKRKWNQALLNNVKTWQCLKIYLLFTKIKWKIFLFYFCIWLVIS